MKLFKYSLLWLSIVLVTFGIALLVYFAVDASGLNKNYCLASIMSGVIYGAILMWFKYHSEKKLSIKKQSVVHAVLYDRFINNVVKTMFVPGFIQVIKLENKNRHDLQDGKMVLSEYEPEFRYYHFFCIQDDGKHIFIERG